MKKWEEVYTVAQGFSNCEGRLPKGFKKGGGEDEAKILHEVKGTGACQCTKDNRTIVSSLTRLSAWSAVGAEVVVTHSLWRQLRYLETLSALAAVFRLNSVLLLRVITHFDIHRIHFHFFFPLRERWSLYLQNLLDDHFYVSFSIKVIQR